ncbi:MAG: polyprenol monophosphomannose synthase [Candidatus Peregrinibacteria bacterium]|nr:polyprenol monophosphomannose synthase [Candidatus Peregrinibacteria bacterium]
MTPSAPLPHSIALVSIILPTYNEAGNIVALVEALDRLVKMPKEIIIVDDNSPDGTSQRVGGMIDARTVPSLRLETRTKDRGLTRSIARGIELAKGDVICWMDCDFSHPPETMAQLINCVANGTDIAVASRYVKGGSYKKGLGWFGADESAFAVLLSRIINWTIRMALDPRFHDYTSGFIAIRRHALEPFLPLRGEYGEYFMELIYRALQSGYSFAEVPFISPPRKWGQTKTGTTFPQLFRRGLPYLLLLPRLRMMRVRSATR